MNSGDTRDALDRVMTASGGLEKLIAELRSQSRETQAEIRATREQEEVQFRQAMVALFRDQQQRTEVALRPKVVLAWQIVAGLSGLWVLLFVGGLLLLKQANDRLQAAQARADAVEIRADVQAALQHVAINSCGGRPCIRIDKRTPTWRSGDNEYILVDGKSGKVADGQR